MILPLVPICSIFIPKWWVNLIELESYLKLFFEIDDEEFHE